jgi:hypothetical protein
MTMAILQVADQSPTIGARTRGVITIFKSGPIVDERGTKDRWKSPIRALEL